MAKFRTQIATQTLARARGAGRSRYAFDVPARLTPAQLPLDGDGAPAPPQPHAQDAGGRVHAARDRRQGKAFIAGAQGARDVALDPCKAQPITLIAETRGRARRRRGDRRRRAPRGSATYEHGMALVATVTERLEEARTVLDAALAQAPDAQRARDGLGAARLGRVEAGPRRRRARARRRGAARSLPAPGRPAGARRDRGRRARARVALGRSDRAGEGVHRARAAELGRVDALRARARLRRRQRRRARRGDARASSSRRAIRICCAARPPRSRRSGGPRPTPRSPPTIGSARPTTRRSCASSAPPTRRAARAIASRATRSC